MKMIEIITFRERENAIYYDYEDCIFKNTYDTLSFKEVIEIISERDSDDIFIDYSELTKASNDYLLHN